MSAQRRWFNCKSSTPFAVSTESPVQAGINKILGPFPVRRGIGIQKDQNIGHGFEQEAGLDLGPHRFLFAGHSLDAFHLLPMLGFSDFLPREEELDANIEREIHCDNPQVANLECHKIFELDPIQRNTTLSFDRTLLRMTDARVKKDRSWFSARRWLSGSHYGLPGPPDRPKGVLPEIRYCRQGVDGRKLLLKRSPEKTSIYSSSK